MQTFKEFTSNHIEASENYGHHAVGSKIPMERLETPKQILEKMIQA